MVSGGNNDIGRMQEMKERSMIYEGLQHYFIVNFPQRAGALREYLDEVLVLMMTSPGLNTRKKQKQHIGRH